MSKFGQDVKAIFNDVYNMLTSLKDSALSNDILAQKKQILAAIDGMRKEYSALTPTVAAAVEAPGTENDELYDDASTVPELPTTVRPTNNILATPSAAAVSSEYHVPSSLEVISDVAATTLTKPLKSGFLSKERKKSGILSLSPNFQKRFCVIQDGVFYYFERADSKKQNGAFRLDNYEAVPVSEGSQKTSANVFQVTCPGKRSYTFKADDSKEMMAWIDIILKSSSIVKRSASVEHKVLAARTQGDSTDVVNDDNTNPDDVYDVTIDGVTPINEPGSDVIDDGEAAMPSSSTPQISGTALVRQPSAASTQTHRPVPKMPISLLPPSSPNVATKEPEEATEELYDFVDETPAAQQPPVTPTAPTSRPLPPPPVAAPPVAAPPVAAPPETIVVRKDDYASMYYGMWDCVANKSFELSFSSGDILHVISSKYEESGWWTATLNGKVGLVPKNYLTPAYIRV